MAFETEDAAIDIWLVKENAGVIDQIAGREIVCAINDDVVFLKNIHHVFARELRAIGGDFHIGVDGRNTVFGGFDFGASHILGPKGHLPLKVGEIGDVKIH